MAGDTDLPNLPPVEIARAVEGAQYPASKDDLLERAKRNGAAHTAMAALDALPQEEYPDLASVTDAWTTVAEREREE